MEVLRKKKEEKSCSGCEIRTKMSKRCVVRFSKDRKIHCIQSTVPENIHSNESRVIFRVINGRREKKNHRQKNCGCLVGLIQQTEKCGLYNKKTSKNNVKYIVF